MNKILILGAGELGSAIINSLLDHPAYDAKFTILTLLVRSSTLSNPPPDRATQLDAFRKRGVEFATADLDNDNQQQLMDIFSKHDTVIHAGAMTSPPGTQLKITKAVIAAKVRTYAPWQWGVDYDIIGKTGGMGLFSEQCDVRDLLRSQSYTKWFIVSCGIFMSFLFEPFWGVLGSNETTGEPEVVRALGGWDHLLTATTVEDIGRCTAELVLVDTDLRNQPIFIAGDSLLYSDFADVVDRVVGKKMRRELWDTPTLRKQAEQDPDSKLRKYRVVFSEDRGLAWDQKKTYNARKGIQMEGCASWLERNTKK